MKESIESFRLFKLIQHMCTSTSIVVEFISFAGRPHSSLGDTHGVCRLLMAPVCSGDVYLVGGVTGYVGYNEILKD